MEPAGRLALRHEGNMWNAYFAMPHTMEGAALIGSISIAAVWNDEDRKVAFMRMMSEIVADILEANIGVRPHFMVPRSAPEHEKAGHS
jgi:hypothetical protein